MYIAEASFFSLLLKKKKKIQKKIDSIIIFGLNAIGPH